MGVKPPHADDIRWDVTADSLFKLCEKHWHILEPELLELERLYQLRTRGLAEASLEARIRRAVQALREKTA